MFSLFFTMLFPQKGNDIQLVSHVDEMAYVYIDNEFVARVRPNKSLGLEMEKGQHDITIVDRNEKVMYRHQHNVQPKEATYIDIQQPKGTLLVQNLSDTEMVLTIDGRRRTVLSKGEKRDFEVVAGEHVVRTFYQIDGHDILLDKETLHIQNKKDRTFLIDDPTAGWVLIENKRNRNLDIVVDGVLYDQVQAKSTLWLSVEFGKNTIEIVDPKGRTISKKSVQVRPYDLEHIEIVAQK